MARVSRTTAAQLRATLNRLAVAEYERREGAGAREARAVFRTHPEERERSMNVAAQSFAAGTQRLTFPTRPSIAERVQRMFQGPRLPKEAALAKLPPRVQQQLKNRYGSFSNVPDARANRVLFQHGLQPPRAPKGEGAMTVRQVLEAAQGRGNLTAEQVRAIRMLNGVERELTANIRDRMYVEDIREEWIREGWYHTPQYYEGIRDRKYRELMGE